MAPSRGQSIRRRTIYAVPLRLWRSPRPAALYPHPQGVTRDSHPQRAARGMLTGHARTGGAAADRVPASRTAGAREDEAHGDASRRERRVQGAACWRGGCWLEGGEETTPLPPRDGAASTVRVGPAARRAAADRCCGRRARRADGRGPTGRTRRVEAAQPRHGRGAAVHRSRWTGVDVSSLRRAGASCSVSPSDRPHLRDRIRCAFSCSPPRSSWRPPSVVPIVDLPSPIFGTRGSSIPLTRAPLSCRCTSSLVSVMATAAGPMATWTPVTPDRGVTKRTIRPPTAPPLPPGSRPSSVAIHYTIRATPTVGAPASSAPSPASPPPSAAATPVAYGEVLEDSRTCRRRRGRPLTVTPGAAAVLPGLEALAGSLGSGEVALGFIAPAWAHGATAASRRRRPALAAATLLVTVERVEVSSPPLPRGGATASGWGAAASPATPAGGRGDRRASRRGWPATANMAVGADGGAAAESSWPIGVALDGRLGGGCQDDAYGAPSVSDVTSDDASERADPSDDEADLPALARGRKRAACQQTPGQADHRRAQRLPARGHQG